MEEGKLGEVWIERSFSEKIDGKILKNTKMLTILHKKLGIVLEIDLNLKYQQNVSKVASIYPKIIF